MPPPPHTHTHRYFTFVFALGRFLRLSVSNMRLRIPTEDLPSTRRLVALCQDIVVARAQSKSRAACDGVGGRGVAGGLGCTLHWHARTRQCLVAVLHAVLCACMHVLAAPADELVLEEELYRVLINIYRWVGARGSLWGLGLKPGAGFGWEYCHRYLHAVLRWHRETVSHMQCDEHLAGLCALPL